MKKTLLIVGLLCFVVVAYPQQTVKESSTGKVFPADIAFTYAGKDYALKVTGLTVRKKVIFKVYGMAHYMQDAPQVKNEDEAFKAILSDGKAKQITMDFARDVDVPKIKEAYADGFKAHTSAEELKRIQPLVDQFVGYFSKDVKENDQFILRWLPGGTIVAIMLGEEKPAITDDTFARALWSIWFSKDSIVDRDELVERMMAQ